MSSFTKGAPGQMANHLIRLRQPHFVGEKTGAENRRNLDANMHLCTSPMFSIKLHSYFESPPILHSQSETNQKARENARISETSEAKKMLSPVQKQDCLNNQVSKYPPSTHYRLRNNPAVARDLFRPPGQCWYYETHKDINRLLLPKGQV